MLLHSDRRLVAGDGHCQMIVFSSEFRFGTEVRSHHGADNEVASR